MGIMLIYFILLFICGCVIENVNATTSSALPELLLDCYRSNFTGSATPPLTIQLLVELIRKIELDDENSLNMRTLSTSMLHGVVFDGIRRFPVDFTDEVVLPYRASGEQFNKYKLVVDYLTSGESSLFPTGSLTTSELCFLHKMISNTVDAWERGDESSTCEQQRNMPYNDVESLLEDNTSRCPIKEGTVNTKWGPISAGHIIAGVASALHKSIATFSRIESAIHKHHNLISTTESSPTIKNITNKNASTNNFNNNNNNSNNNVNNIWVSTIAGDLAAVILSQATNSPEIGTGGFWNDTLLPRRYYLKSSLWDMTEPEILGGVDALIIASNVEKWYNKANTIRLSQLIDMYYSDRGMAYNKQCRAANRTSIFHQLLNEVNLDEQVIGTASLLQGIATYSVSLRKNETISLAPNVTKKFKIIADNITKKYDNIEYIDGKKMKAPVEFLIILDGSYDPYRAQQILYALSEATQVSYYGSKLGVINGQSGNWMVNVTGEVFQLFNDLHRAENLWPSTLFLGRSLETAIEYYQKSSVLDCANGVTKPRGRAIVILSNSIQLTDGDLSKAKQAIKSIKTNYPETSFILSENAKSTGLNELKQYLGDNDYFLNPSNDVHSFVDQLSRTLCSIPGNIINFYCNKSQVRLEDYITPDIETFYQIRQEYIQQGHIKTNFSNSNYGDLMVCVNSSSSLDMVCKDLTVNGEISFDSKQLCKDKSTCNLVYVVSVNSTKIMCTERDCRYPDQVRVDVVWEKSSGSIPATFALLLIYLTLCIMFLTG